MVEKARQGDIQRLKEQIQLFSIDLGKGKLTKKCSRSEITSISLQKAKEIYK